MVKYYLIELSDHKKLRSLTPRFKQQATSRALDQALHFTQGQSIAQFTDWATFLNTPFVSSIGTDKRGIVHKYTENYIFIRQQSVLLRSYSAL